MFGISGRVGQSVLTDAEGLPTAPPKWQKMNHTAAVKVRWGAGKSRDRILTRLCRLSHGVHGKAVFSLRAVEQAIKRFISGERSAIRSRQTSNPHPGHQPPARDFPPSRLRRK